MNQINLSIWVGAAILAAMLFGCGVKVTTIDFSCRSYGLGPMILTDCADLESWRKWDEQKQKEVDAETQSEAQKQSF